MVAAASVVLVCGVVPVCVRAAGLRYGGSLRQGVTVCVVVPVCGVVAVATK